MFGAFVFVNPFRMQCIALHHHTYPLTTTAQKNWIFFCRDQLKISHDINKFPKKKNEIEGKKREESSQYMSNVADSPVEILHRRPNTLS